MTEEQFRAIVARAMLAPSTHNAQPARWSLRDSAIVISADLTRRLPIGDPDDRDLHVSIGAAVEGTVLALSALGHGAKVTWLHEAADGPLQALARVEAVGPANATDQELATVMEKRVTHRAGFEPVALDLTHLRSDHTAIVENASDVGWLSKQVDIASASIMKDRAFRNELLDWMRLSKTDPSYDRDGLNREALAMDRLTAAVTRPVLGTALYSFLSGLGLGPALSGEASRSAKGGAIALFHWPKSGSRLEAGRAFYRLWLEATQLGLAGWPAAALADDGATRQAVEARFALPEDHVLLNALRLGRAKGAAPTRSRLSLEDVIL